MTAPQSPAPRRPVLLARSLFKLCLCVAVAAPVTGCGPQPPKQYNPHLVDLDKISAKGGPEQITAWALQLTDGGAILAGKAVLLNDAAGPDPVRARQAADGFLRVHEKLATGWPGLAPPRRDGPAGATDFDPPRYRRVLVEDSYYRLAAMHQARPDNALIADLFRRIRPDDDAELMTVWREQGARAGLVK